MRDLISREAVLDEVRTECSLVIFDSYGNLTFAGERIIEAIKRVPSVEPERSVWNKYYDDDPKTWPEDGSWGLWQHKSGALNVLRWKQDALNHFYPDPYMWDIEDVVAWMPLPKPYKAESEEGVKL